MIKVDYKTHLSYSFLLSSGLRTVPCTKFGLGNAC